MELLHFTPFSLFMKLTKSMLKLRDLLSAFLTLFVALLFVINGDMAFEVSNNLLRIGLSTSISKKST